MLNYKSDAIKLEKSYTIEYLDGEKALEKFNRAILKNSSVNPCEVYTSRTFSNAEEAYNSFTVFSIRDDIYDAKMFETITINGEIVSEEVIQMQEVTRTTAATIINNDLRNELVKARKAAKLSEEVNKKKSDFCTIYINEFNKFLKQ